ncbi:MAG: UDP-4-amino-4,6-dideoxy-N-acetyl-beta-L-altrosamine transaminase [Sulfurospirillum sp.]|nr:UDP-4-amino-4,6-dideoxy-N-acetyl-beta-L-altrosamine transaminase [Sulfurospirillum sp.]
MKHIHYGKQTINEDDIIAITNAMTNDLLTTGPTAKKFEEALSVYCGAKYTIAVSSATAALHLSSLVLLNNGDKVLTTPNSFLATSNAILYVNAKPIFVDIEKDGNINLDLCEKELQKDPTIKAIYGVHFSGNPLDQNKLKNLRKIYNVLILEDCAHSIGAIYDGVKAGSCTNSDCSIFSFHPVKNMTTGEGGAITTNSKELYEKLLILRNHGMVKTQDMKPWEYEMQHLGFNYRITDIQCALGISQLKKLPMFIERRFDIAKKYDAVFKNSIVKPLYAFDKKSSYHLYVVRVDFHSLNITKVDLFNKLKEKNIGIQLHYMPINKQPYYRNLGYGDENTPNMDRYYKQCFSLPIYPLLSDEEQDYVVKTLMEILNG